MKDLTNSSIAKNILYMALPITAGMIFQTLYFLIDLYFVGGLGSAALAGVGAAGNVTFIVMAVTQVLGVGTVTLISHAAGRKDQADANLVFNQSLAMSGSCGLLMLLLGYLAGPYFMASLGSDAATVAAGIRYLHWYLPSLGLQFAVVAMGSALRGTGIVRPAMLVQMLTVILNAVLAPVLIAGWGTGYPMGVAGAGLASSLALAVGVVMLGLYFHRLEKYVGFDAKLWRPQFATWRRLLRIGLPAGGEFALMFIIMAVIYWIIRRFGEDAQAGFGIGTRMMQCLFLPAMAVAFATAPIVGQNYAAGKYSRVRETFGLAILIGSCIMVCLTVFCQWGSELVVGAFTKDATAVHVGAEYLRVISWNFLANGFVFTCSGVFQGLGNTIPSVLSSASRVVTFVVPALWLASTPHFELIQVWYVSIGSVTLQAIFSFWLVRREFRLRLPLAAETVAVTRPT
ncbi:MAG TPA: MATE family efflux transporter [Steroidobacteraceae bacterium]|jgi:putative MATE family efflux protein|nr:MATE family efflux transporter [Steroidobacteraceae bacterium]